MRSILDTADLPHLPLQSKNISWESSCSVDVMNRPRAIPMRGSPATSAIDSINLICSDLPNTMLRHCDSCSWCGLSCFRHGGLRTGTSSGERSHLIFPANPLPCPRDRSLPARESQLPPRDPTLHLGAGSKRSVLRPHRTQLTSARFHLFRTGGQDARSVPSRAANSEHTPTLLCQHHRHPPSFSLTFPVTMHPHGLRMGTTPFLSQTSRSAPVRIRT